MEETDFTPAENEEKPRRTRLWLIIALGTVLALALLVYLCCYPGWVAAAAPTPSPTPVQPKTEEDFVGLRCYFLDVGQGDCAFLRSVNGRTMLIDAGPEGSFGKIKLFLDRQGVARLDTVICTHFHTDHFGSLSEVLDHYEVGELYVSPFDVENSAYANLLAAMERNNVTGIPLYAAANSLIPWDSTVEVRVLSPYETIYQEENDASLVVRVLYGESAVLFTGDAGIVAEKLAMKALPDHYFRANVLKVGHHGSNDATSQEFLETVKPAIAVISVGADNGYGLPDETVLQRLKEHNVRVLRTDIDKTVLIALDGTDAWVVE